MNVNTLFFDIDGTLVSFNTHTIPPSTIDALERAKRRGVRVFIATGRPIQFIVNLKPIAHLIDGYITTNGARCMVGDHTVSLHQIEADDVARILRASEDWEAPCVVVGTEHIAVTRHQSVVDKVFGEGLGLAGFGFANLDIVLQEPILQLTPFLSAEQEAELMPTLKACTSGRWTPAFTDITHVDADKGKGLLAMAAYLGLTPEATMAFGDGGNDISILRQAGIGVAMGNAGNEVKKNADFVTTGVDEDGIEHALKAFGVI